jgi:hypothetical protein
MVSNTIILSKKSPKKKQQRQNTQHHQKNPHLTMHARRHLFNKIQKRVHTVLCDKYRLAPAVADHGSPGQVNERHAQPRTPDGELVRRHVQCQPYHIHPPCSPEEFLVDDRGSPLGAALCKHCVIFPSLLATALSTPASSATGTQHCHCIWVAKVGHNARAYGAKLGCSVVLLAKAQRKQRHQRLHRPHFSHHGRAARNAARTFKQTHGCNRHGRVYASPRHGVYHASKPSVVLLFGHRIVCREGGHRLIDVLDSAAQPSLLVHESELLDKTKHLAGPATLHKVLHARRYCECLQQQRARVDRQRAHLRLGPVQALRGLAPGIQVEQQGIDERCLPHRFKHGQRVTFSFLCRRRRPVSSAGAIVLLQRLGQGRW